MTAFPSQPAPAPAGPGTPLGFLSDIHRPPAGRAAALTRVTALLGSDDPGDLFRASNLLALVHFRSGAADLARELCHELIAHALAHRGGPRWPEFAVLALQPQINLIRLIGYAPDRVDEALAQLDALEPLTFGRGAELPALSLDEDTVRCCLERGLLDRSTIRNVLVHDTCQVLWRHRLDRRLVEAAGRHRRLWPDLPDESTVQHAAEAPWLVGAPDLPDVSLTDLDQPTVAVRRLAYVRLLHVARHAAAAGAHELAAELVVGLAARRDLTAGRFASSLTPLRWLGSLAATARHLDLGEVARPLLGELGAHPEVPEDRALRRLLQTMGAPCGPTGTPTEPHDEAAPDAAALTGIVRERLAVNGRARVRA